MGLHADGDVKVTRWSTVDAGIAFPGHTEPRTSGYARGDPDFHGLRGTQPAISLTRRADIFEPAFTVTARARQAKFHGARHLGHLAGTVTLGADHVLTAGRPGAMASAALFLAIDVQLYLGAPDGLPEIDIEAVLQVGATIGNDVSRLPLAAFEELAENIAEAACALGTTSPSPTLSAGSTSSSPGRGRPGGVEQQD